MRRNLEQRDIEFRAAPGGVLERAVTLPDGRTYAHRCSKEVFEKVAAFLDDHAGVEFKTRSLADAIGAPITQTDVAVRLLDERGLIEVREGRTRIAAGYDDAFHEHAMTEFLVLVDGGPPVS